MIEPSNQENAAKIPGNGEHIVSKSVIANELLHM
jgi:hypothetical protein